LNRNINNQGEQKYQQAKKQKQYQSILTGLSTNNLHRKINLNWNINKYYEHKNINNNNQFAQKEYYSF